MEQFSYELKVTKDRVAVLIGKKGEIKKEIEDSTSTKIEVDSKEGDVFIRGEDAIGLFNAKEVVRAISRGFNPQYAMLLLKGDYVFELINLMDYSGKSANTMQRLKGRVIGKEGKSRKYLEQLTETYICVYGKTIGIIGQPANVSVCKKAVESLLSGSPHNSVYKYLEKKRRDLKKMELESIENT